MTKISRDKIERIQVLHASGKSIRKISEETGNSCFTVYFYTSLIRRDFRSPIDYFNYLARKMGYGSHLDYLEILAMRKGDDSRSERERGYTRQKKFEHGEETRGISGIVIPHVRKPLEDYPGQKLEQKEFLTKLQQALETLGEKEDGARLVLIIKKRFFEGYSLEACGRLLGKTRERISKLEKEALRKLFFIGKEIGLDLYIPGEVNLTF